MENNFDIFLTAVSLILIFRFLYYYLYVKLSRISFIPFKGKHCNAVVKNNSIWLFLIPLVWIIIYFQKVFFLLCKYIVFSLH